jgi:hypothetical protein
MELFKKLRQLGLCVILGLLTACQNAIPTVTRLESARTLTPVEAKDSKNFSQINSGSTKEVLTGGYMVKLRIAQPLAEMKATTASGYKLKGTIHLN